MNTPKWICTGTLFITMALLAMPAYCQTRQSNLLQTATVDGVKYTYYITNSTAILAPRDYWERAISTNTAGGLSIPAALDGHPTRAIDAYAFRGCASLTSVIIPDGVERIEQGAFDKCSALASVILPDCVKIIADCAFQQCESLTEIAIPNSVTNIGAGAFQACSSLESVSIPKSVVTIERPGDTFDDCNSLRAVNVDKDNPSYKSIDGILFDKVGTNLLIYPRVKQGAYTVPDGVETIGLRAFGNCNGLTSITLPASVREIQSLAFSACSNLTSVTLNEGINSIQGWAFFRCTRLGSITLPKSVEHVGSGTFMECHNLKAIAVHPDNPKYSSVDGVLLTKDNTVLVAYPPGKQGAYAVPDGVQRIEDAPFGGCNGLTSLYLPPSLEMPQRPLVYRCANLTAITVDPANTDFASIDGVLFDKACTSLLLYPRGRQGAYTIPSSVRRVRSEAFQGCNGLTAITIPDGVVDIQEGAFLFCSNLTSVTLPNTIETIQGGTFYKCTSLRSVTIPSNVKVIRDTAFFHCNSLTDIAIPSSVTNISPSAFRACSNITSVVIPPCVTNLQETFPDSYKKITNVVRLATVKE